MDDFDIPAPLATSSTDSWKQPLEVLNQSVLAIQTQLAEKKKPWHKTTSNVFSVIGMVVSLTIAMATQQYQRWNQQKQNDEQAISSKTSRLIEIAAQLVELRRDYTTKAVNADYSTIAATSGLFQTRKVLLLQEAESLAKSISKPLPPGVVSLVAWEIALDGRVLEAISMLISVEKQTANTRSRAESQLLYQNLATLHSQVKTGDKAKSNAISTRYWKLTEALFQDAADDGSLAALSQVYAGWAGTERQNGNLESANELIARAKARAELISPINSNRAFLLMGIGLSRAFISSGESELARAKTLGEGSWEGEWTAKDFPGADSTRVLITMNRITNTYDFRAELSRSQRMIGLLFGSLVILPGGRANSMFRGSMQIPSRPGQPAFADVGGILELHAENPLSAVANFKMLGEPSLEVRIQKVGTKH